MSEHKITAHQIVKTPNGFGVSIYVGEEKVFVRLHEPVKGSRENLYLKSQCETFIEIGSDVIWKGCGRFLVANVEPSRSEVQLIRPGSNNVYAPSKEVQKAKDPFPWRRLEHDDVDYRKEGAEIRTPEGGGHVLYVGSSRIFVRLFDDREEAFTIERCVTLTCFPQFSRGTRIIWKNQDYLVWDPRPRLGGFIEVINTKGVRLAPQDECDCVFYASGKFPPPLP